VILNNEKLCELAIENIDKFYSEIHEDKNGRYMSWEHCYKIFNENKNNKERDIDLLALNLFAYLSSWGMLRSSFLLQKDYKAHSIAVEEICKEKYAPLWNVKCEELLNKDTMALLMEVTNELRSIYIKVRENIDNYKGVSDILITKILMGTFGCVPAYDTMFKSGVIKYKVAIGTYNEKSIVELSNFYINNNDMFEKCRMNISKNGLEYPQMKLLDMCFWQIGCDLASK